MISNARRAFIRDGVVQGARNDGRSPMDVRPIFLETNCMPHTDGSAHLRLGWGTEAQVAVKLELEKEPEGRIEIYIEEHPHFEKLIHQWAMESVDLELLRVDDNLHWRVLIDCAVVSADGFSLTAPWCPLAAA